MEYIKEKDCVICYENINATHVKCVMCNILMCVNCELKYRKGKNYCKCPHCLQVGYIGGIEKI